MEFYSGNSVKFFGANDSYITLLFSCYIMGENCYGNDNGVCKMNDDLDDAAIIPSTMYIKLKK